ncbi:T9SS type A sorting domain-containing protein [Hymenobacter busanensis]|nr:T9SS type A sorting domain-containing protein [Hymenobacter busanensis]QHJ08027.1 T9SS type A sorting domain-containing protein [Hymenobacter busanensis]
MIQHLYSRISRLGYLLAGLLVLGSAGSSQAQVAAPSYYSAFANPASPAQYQAHLNGIVCLVGCGILNPSNVADLDLTNYTTIQSTLAVGDRARLRMALNGTAPLNYRAGVVLGSSNTLDAAALGAIIIRTYAGGVQQQQLLANATGVSATTMADGRTRVEFTAAKAFDQVEVDVLITAGVLRTLQVYYAFGIDAGVVTSATGFLSRLTAPSASDYQTTSGGGLLCAGTGVTSPQNAVSGDLNDFAVLSTAAGVGCKSSLQVRLEGKSPAGYQAGFVIGNGSLLDLDVLKALKVTTYLNGKEQETASAADLLQVTLLPNNRYQVSFATKEAFDRVELQQSSLLNVLSNLNVYYGFGIEPRAFRDEEPVLSDFSTPQAGTDYTVSGSSLLCVGCSLTNPERAADNIFSPTDFAQMNFPVTALGTQRIKLRLNGNGAAGNRAGMVLRTNTGLLSASLLSNVTLRTYGADGALQESASGSQLLSTGVLGGGLQEISFPTTQDFEWVEVEVRGGVGLFSNAQIFYAFADDPTQGFPSEVKTPAPLPVVLKSFTAKVLSEAVQLNWETASEKASSYFEVERATSPKEGFTAVGRVKAAGNTSSSERYTLRDADVVRQPAGLLYYRLKQVDLDGTTTYTAPVTVLWQPTRLAELVVYPNPATDAATVQVSAENQGVGTTLVLYGSRGELLRRQPVHNATETLSLAGLKAGLYHIVLFDAAGRKLGAQALAVQGR